MGTTIKTHSIGQNKKLFLTNHSVVHILVSLRSDIYKETKLSVFPVNLLDVKVMVKLSDLDKTFFPLLLVAPCTTALLKPLLIFNM